MIPLLLGMGLWGRVCLCPHAGSVEPTGAVAHEQLPEENCGGEEDCDSDEDCCCFEGTPTETSQLAEAGLLVVQEDPSLVALMDLSIPVIEIFTSAVNLPVSTTRIRESEVPWPERLPLFALFESYLC